MVGALNWTYSDSGLVSGAYTYSARVVDLAGNITSSSDFVLTVDTSIPTTLAQITSQTTRDTTPIISGVITAALASGQYVEVVINGKTYTSEPGGAVVVDPAHNTVCATAGYRCADSFRDRLYRYCAGKKLGGQRQ